jgi:hypothetical protein
MELAGKGKGRGKGKGKAVLVFNLASRHEDVRESGGRVPHLLNLGTAWRRVVSFTFRLL